MRTGSVLLVLVASLGGCLGRQDYSRFADRSMPVTESVCTLDARLRTLLDRAPRDLAPFMDSARRGAGRAVAPILHPDDTDLVPSLAWERGRGGCTPLCLFQARRGALEPVLLPGHMALRRPDGSFLEPLRGGLPRDSTFYDSAFHLARRPWYRPMHRDSAAVVAALLVQAGLLEWRRGDRRSAASAFGAAARLVPGFPEAEGNLGLVLAESGDRTAAVGHLRTALAGDSLHGAARDVLRRLLD